MSIRQWFKSIALRGGIELTRARRSPRPAEPSFTDPFHEQRRLFCQSEQLNVFDVGAHVGQTALTYHRLLPKATIYAFEPHRPSFEQLVKTVGGISGVVPIHAALGRQKGKGHLFVNRSSATNSLLSTDRRAEESWDQPDRIDTVAREEVDITCLDLFLAEQPFLDHVDILKLDVQGSELDVLEGARETLSKRRVSAVYTEVILAPTYVGQRALDEYLKYLREFGFRLHNFYNPCCSVNGRLNQCDALFVLGD